MDATLDPSAKDQYSVRGSSARKQPKYDKRREKKEPREANRAEDSPSGVGAGGPSFQALKELAKPATTAARNNNGGALSAGRDDFNVSFLPYNAQMLH